MKANAELPPIVTNIHYEIADEGIWLQVTPAVGNPTSVFIPNRLLGKLARVLSGRAATLVDGTREGE